MENVTCKKSIAIIAIVGITGSQSLMALPVNGQVQSGSAVISGSANTTTITQNSGYGEIHWDSFDIAEGETVIFDQPGSDSVTLNTIFDSDPSSILGNLQSNGQVFLSNPNGFIFGNNSSVNVGSLLATTATIDSFDLNTGAVTFSGSEGGQINNHGSLQAEGYIGFFAPEITNSGNLSSGDQGIALSSETRGTLYLPGYGNVGFAVDGLSSTKAVAINHSGMINTEGGQVLISSKALDGTLLSAINSSGIIDTSTMAIDGNSGTITISASNGSVDLSGNVNAGNSSLNVGANTITVSDTLSYDGSLSGSYNLNAATVVLHSDIDLGASANLNITSDTLSVNSLTDDHIALTASSLNFVDDPGNSNKLRVTLVDNLDIHIADHLDLSQALVRGQGSSGLALYAQPSSLTSTVDMGATSSLSYYNVTDISTLKLNSSIQTFGEGIKISLSDTGVIELAGNVKLQDSSSGEIRIDSDIQGAGYDLSLDTLDGDIRLKTVADVRNLDIESLNGTVNLRGDINASDHLQMVGIPDINASGDVSLTASSINLRDSDFTSSGNVTLNAASGTINSGNLTAGSINIKAETLNLYGNLSADLDRENSLNLESVQTVLLQTDTRLSGNLLYNQIDSASSDYSLDIKLGHMDFNLDNIGRTTGFSGFSLTGHGELFLTHSPLVSGSAGFSILGAMSTTLTDTFALDTSAVNGKIDLSGLTIDGEADLILTSGSGDISLGNIGATTALTNISLNTSGAINLYDNIRVDAKELLFQQASAIILHNDLIFGSEELILDQLDFGNASIDGTYNLTVYSTAFKSGNIGQNTALQDISLNLTGESHTITHDIRAAGDIRINTTLLDQQADIISSGGNVELSTQTGISMAADSMILANLGEVSLYSVTGDIALSSITSNQQVTVSASSGKITNAINDFESNNNTSININAPQVILKATSGIGTSVASPVVVAAGAKGNINVSADGNIHIANINNSATNLNDSSTDISLLTSLATADAVSQINTPTYIATPIDKDMQVYSPEWYSEPDVENRSDKGSPRIYRDRLGWRLGNPQ